MRGFITENCNARELPAMDALITGVYNTGDLVEIERDAVGEEYDAEDLWYQLSNGTYVWSGAISIMRDGSALPPEERKQYLISYRKRNEEDGRPDLDPKSPAQKLYFTQLQLPANPDTIQVDELTPQEFAQQVVQLVAPVDAAREHVFIYIHGYQMISSLKLELLAHFVQSYMTHQNNKIAKVLFFAWPAQGLSRKTVDDRSIRAGQQFNEKKLFNYWEVLSKALSDNGRKLNLLVHSFGHQFLNGMLNPEKGQVDHIPSNKVFENIFLMAPDITHMALQKDGVLLKNNFADSGIVEYHYQFSKLKDLASQVHVFHDKYDYLLHVGTKKFLEKRMRRSPDETDLDLIRKYRALGNFANLMIPDLQKETGFNFWDVEDLIKKNVEVDAYDFPFRTLKKKMTKSIDRLWNSSDYSEINFFQTLFSVGRTPDHHRYLFTCKQVVDKLQELL